MFVLVNLKAYDCDPVAIGEAARSVATDYDGTVAVAPQATHIHAVAETGVQTWAQHVSPTEHGSNTGSTLAEATADAGATGTLLNHSEQRLTLANIDDSLTAARRAGLSTVVCANTPDQIAAATALGPDAVAVEPPALIGTGTPVSQADPDIVRDAVAAAEDLGADGVLLASGVAKAEDPEAALQDLVES